MTSLLTNIKKRAEEALEEIQGSDAPWATDEEKAPIYSAAIKKAILDSVKEYDSEVIKICKEARDFWVAWLGCEGINSFENISRAKGRIEQANAIIATIDGRLSKLLLEKIRALSESLDEKEEK